MIANIRPLQDDDPFPFGVQRQLGRKMKDVPADYLDWLHGQPWLGKWAAVKEYIERNRKTIDWELKRDGKI